MPGPVALLGGLEHHEPMLPLDRRVLDEVGVFAPEVVIVPVASFGRQAAAAGSLAQRHWSGLGASTRVVLPRSGCDEAALDALSTADVIVLPGGVPNRLMRALDGTPILRMIIDRWEAGAGIAGSSAGAIGLFERRLNLYPPSPFRLIPGLGLLIGYVAAPHFDRLRVARWFRPIVERMEVGVIGLDESTGLVGRDGSMMVMGAGSVTIATRSGVDVWPNGATIDLALIPAVHGAVPPGGVHPALESAQAPTTSANSGRVMAPLVSNVS